MRGDLMCNEAPRPMSCKGGKVIHTVQCSDDLGSISAAR